MSEEEKQWGTYTPNNTFKTSDGIQIKYFDVGKKTDDTVLLIHGFLTSTLMFDQSGKAILTTTPIIDGLLEKEFRVVAMDCRGHGMSEKPRGVSYYGMQMVKDQVELMDHLEIDTFHVAGWSMGAELGLKLTVDYPDRVRSLLLYASGWSYGTNWENEGIYYRVLHPCSSWMGCIWATVHCCWYPCCCCCVHEPMFGEPDNDMKALQDVCRGMLDVMKIEESEIKAINVPVVCICGDQDEELPFQKRMEGKVKDFKLVIIEGQDHLKACGDPLHHETFMGFYNH